MINKNLSKISEFGIWLIQWFGDFSKDIKVLQIRTLNSIIRFLVAPLRRKAKAVKSWFPNEIGIFCFPQERKKRQNITVSGVPIGGARKVERESPPNKIISLWFAIFCVSRKRAWFPTFVQRKNCRNMKRNSFNVLFFIKKAKLLKNGEASVCMRITVKDRKSVV